MTRWRMRAYAGPRPPFGMEHLVLSSSFENASRAWEEAKWADERHIDVWRDGQWVSVIYMHRGYGHV